jgi:epoxyqueuosine reductase
MKRGEHENGGGHGAWPDANPSLVLSAQEVHAAARECGFALVGLARAEPLDSRPLLDWLERGCAADLSAMRRRTCERLDPGAIVPGAKSVLVLGIPYGKSDAVASPVIARYARGRDYHYAHRDRMRRLRGRLLALDPGLRTYACVDSGAAMEKAWAERAGLGFIGKNGLVIHRDHGSLFTLSLMVVDRAVDAYDSPRPRLCGQCTKCIDACPTQAFASPGVVDARRCLSYHTVENHGEVPLELRARLGSRVFGCDACQETCPFNQGEIPPGDPRQAPRTLGLMTATQIAGLTEAQFNELATGTPMRRIGYHGLRRNACLALGATRDHQSRALLASLTTNPSPLVAEAARWALQRLDES